VLKLEAILVWLFHGSFPLLFSDFRSGLLEEATIPFLSSQFFTQLMRHYPERNPREIPFSLRDASLSLGRIK
jgi:hypothetical protein